MQVPSRMLALARKNLTKRLQPDFLTRWRFGSYELFLLILPRISPCHLGPVAHTLDTKKAYLYL